MILGELVTDAGAAGRRQHPVAPGQRVVQRVALGAALARPATAQVVVETDVIQVVERQQVIAGNGDTALLFSGRVCAAIISRKTKAKEESLLPTDKQIAFADLISRNDLDFSFGRGYALEVLLRLLDIAQVKQDGVSDSGKRAS